MKAADIPDVAFLDAIDEANRRRTELTGHTFTAASRWDVASVLAGHPEAVGTAESARSWPDTPSKVVLSKIRRLVHKGLVAGCSCGCRGNLEVSAKGREYQRGHHAPPESTEAADA